MPFTRWMPALLLNMQSAEAPLQRRARQRLQGIADADRMRVRKPVSERTSRDALCADGIRRRVFCSNDYLGLAADPRLVEAARRVATAGSTASQHVCGYGREQAALEEEVAAALGVERALVGGSGYALNTGALPVLAGSGDVIHSDALNHASLIDGCRLSRADVRRYNHCDIGELAQQLAQGGAGMPWIVTDALFSMDGDVAPLAELAELSGRHGGALYVDDAHGFGWAGDGRGHLAASGVSARGAVQMVGFGKALGSYGAALAGSAEVIEWLLQSARTTMFSTALPPAVSAATRAALRITQSEPEHRVRLHRNIARFRALCAQAGVGLAPSGSPIQAVILGGEARALAWQQALWQAGFWVNAIRPPTVPAGTARLRITLSAAHADADIESLVTALQAIGEREAATSMSA